MRPSRGFSLVRPLLIQRSRTHITITWRNKLVTWIFAGVNRSFSVETRKRVTDRERPYVESLARRKFLAQRIGIVTTDVFTKDRRLEKAEGWAVKGRSNPSEEAANAKERGLENGSGQRAGPEGIELQKEGGSNRSEGSQGQQSRPAVEGHRGTIIELPTFSSLSVSRSRTNERRRMEKEENRTGKAATASSSPAPKKDWTHLERTSSEPRQETLHNFFIKNVRQATDNVRTVELRAHNSHTKFTHKAGQWVDVYVPNSAKPGGFTVTSYPSLEEQASADSSISLAIQRSPSNPVAQWFWQDETEIKTGQVRIRAGGSFVYPPEEGRLEHAAITDVVFVCGGLGINPFMSMLYYMFHNGELTPGHPNFKKVSLLYSSGAENFENILFLNRLKMLYAGASGLEAVSSFTGKVVPLQLSVDFFFTRAKEGSIDLHIEEEYFDRVKVHYRRMRERDMVDKISEERAETTALYVCGPQGMTDEFVELAGLYTGLKNSQIFFEKWW